MPVCRYFLQGNCRFGDRCRFEHTYSYESNAYDNSGDYSDYQNRGRSQASHSNYYDHGRDRQYNEKYAPNQQYYSSERSYQDPRYNYNESYNQSSEPDYYANKYNRNKHTWVSDDYKKQIEQKTQQSGNDNFFDTSTPKSKTTFSFKDTNVQSSKTTFSFKDTNVQSSKNQPKDLMSESNLIDAEIIKEDVVSWESSNQWPFTCYCPKPKKPAFPGFADLSPEELRLEAYKAKENNTYNLYVESVEKLLQDIKMRWQQMKEPSVQLMSIIEKIRKGENTNFQSVVDGNASPLAAFNQATSKASTALEDMVADESSSLPQNAPFGFGTTAGSFFGPQTSASTFSFKTALSTDEVPKSGASSFSFKVPPESASKSNAQVTSNDIYTPIDAISEQDKEQFAAPTFTLGKIPTVPPSQEMCF